MRLEPLAYQHLLVTWIEKELTKVWDWFRSHAVRVEQTSVTRLELLKTTYRLEASHAERVYRAAHQAAEALEIAFPITIYQSQRADTLNASLVPIPGEVHVVLHGPVLETLNDQELTVLFAHELAHSLLWNAWDTRYLTGHEVLSALTNHPGTTPAQIESSRRYQLYTELFCDRGSLLAIGDLDTVVATLVKMETGTRDVDGAAYLQQAAEILQSGVPPTEACSHPECFLRARALQLWRDNETAAEVEIRGLIEGQLSLKHLDLLGQSQLQALTRSVLDHLLIRRWMRTDAVLAHARLFFDDYVVPDSIVNGDLAGELTAADESVRDYVCFLLLDFCTADSDLEESPLAESLGLADSWQVGERFEELVRKELKLTKKRLALVRQKSRDLVARADQSVDTQ